MPLFFDLPRNDHYDLLSLPGTACQYDYCISDLCLTLNSLERCIVSTGHDTSPQIGHMFFIRMGNTARNGKKVSQ